MAIQTNFPAIKPSLLLDFASVKQLDPRITYTRASTATFYNGVTTAMAEQNLFTYSQDFSNAAWTKAGTTITANSTTAPDGTTTASTVTASGGGIVNRVAQTSISGTFMFSFYAKANTQNFIQLNQNSSSNNFANFDLSTGTVGTVGASTTATITSVGNSWYRCTMTVASATSGVLGLYVIDSSTAAAFATTTSTSNFYIWGAQLEQRSAVSAYTATTTQAITNYIPVLQTAASGVARFDNNPTTGESLGLLIEESRTNLQTYSEQFDNASWVKNQANVSANVAVAPDGTLTADKLFDDGTASSTHRLVQTVTVASGTTYALSVYAKAAERTFIVLQLSLGFANTPLAYFNLTNGTVGTTIGSPSATITSVGNGWYRCTITAVANISAAGCQPYIYLASADNTVIYNGNGYSGVFIWGAQVEAGAFATSYIPTVASQVTRAADAASMTGTNFSTWYNAAEGTIYQEVNPRILSGSYAPAWITSGDSITNNGIGSFLSTAGHLYVEVSGSVQCSIDAGTVTASTNNKIAGTYKTNDFAAVIDNGTVGTDAVGVIPTVDRVMIGRYGSTYMNGTIKKIAYYPLRVTNAQLQALTS